MKDQHDKALNHLSKYICNNLLLDIILEYQYAKFEYQRNKYSDTL